MNSISSQAPRARLLSVSEVASVANVSTRMAQRLIAERRLPTVKIGRHVRVWETDLDEYLRANTRPPAVTR